MREGKELLLDEIKEKIDSSTGFIMTSYDKMSAAASRALRDDIAEVQGEFEVVRKRLFLKALEKSGVSVEGISLEGHIGVMFTEGEASTLAKAALDFTKKNQDMLTFIGGVIDETICFADEIIQLAKLPSLNELRAQFVGLLEAPMSQTVGTMQAALASILYCFDAKSNKG